jgi:hypothetical protein
MLPPGGTVPVISRFASDHHTTAGPTPAAERRLGRTSPTYAVGSRGPYISRLIIGLDLQTHADSGTWPDTRTSTGSPDGDLIMMWMQLRT